MILEQIFAKLLTFDPKNYKIQFENYHQDYLNELKNSFKKETYDQALTLQENALKLPNYFHPLDMIEHLKHINFDKFLLYHDNIFNNLKLEW